MFGFLVRAAASGSGFWDKNVPKTPWLAYICRCDAIILAGDPGR